MDLYLADHLDHKERYERQQDDQYRVLGGPDTFLVLVDGDEQVDPELRSFKRLLVSRPLLRERTVIVEDVPLRCEVVFIDRPFFRQKLAVKAGIAQGTAQVYGRRFSCRDKIQRLAAFEIQGEFGIRLEVGRGCPAGFRGNARRRV